MAQPPRIRRRLPTQSSADITAALEGRPPTTPPANTGPRPATRFREIRATSADEMVQRVAARARETGGPVRLSVNGQEIAVLGDIQRESARRQVDFAASMSRMPPELLAQAGAATGATPEEIADLGAGIREAAINQTLEGMRANPMMVPMVREMVARMAADPPMDGARPYDPEEDQLALALRRFDAENAPPAPAPDEPTPPPAPSRPVRNWGD